MTRLRELVGRTSGLPLPQWLERLASAGIVTTDPEVARRQRFTNIAAYVIAANAASHLVINAVYDFRGLLVVHVYNALIMAVALCVPRFHRFGDHVGAVAFLLFTICGNLFVVWALGLDSDLHIYFTLAGGMLFLFGVQNWRLFAVFFALTAAALLFALHYAPADGLVAPEDVALRDLLSTHALINALVVNAAIIFYALTALRRAEVASEALIASVMPPAIAERLKAGADRIADRIENLSVLFADLVDFTAAVHALPPDAVVDYLDRLVRTFDALCEQHGVDKIKTIGDCYMAAAGLDGSGAAGTVAIGRFALAMLAEIEHHPALGGRKLALRIGIHCGPATAGVIGDTRFSYDVWGDAVNVAARMESHGVPGRIQVSDAFRALTGHAFVFEERGTTDIKGIGAARTFFLVGCRSDAIVAPGRPQ
jgi:adenylate cyclase